MLRNTIALVVVLGGFLLSGCGALPSITLAPDAPLPCLIDVDCEAGYHCDQTRMQCLPNTDGDADSENTLDGDAGDNDTLDPEPDTDAIVCSTLKRDPTPGLNGLSTVDLGVVKPFATASTTLGLSNAGPSPITFSYVSCVNRGDGQPCNTNIWWLASITYPRGYSKSLQRDERFPSFSINPGETAYLAILFTPNSSAAEDVQFTVIADDCEGVSHFQLTANQGLRAELLLFLKGQTTAIASSTIFEWPSLIESCDAPLDLTFSACNMGQKELHLTGMTLSPLQGISTFTLPDKEYPVYIEAGACEDITITYQMQGAGLFTDVAQLSIDNDADNTVGMPYFFAIRVKASLPLFRTPEDAGDFGKVVIADNSTPCTSYHQDQCPAGEVCCAEGQLCIADACRYERVVPVSSCWTNAQDLVWTAKIVALPGDTPDCAARFKVKIVSLLNPGGGLPGSVTVDYTPPASVEGQSLQQKCSLVLSLQGAGDSGNEKVVPLRATIAQAPIARLSRESHGPIITEPITAAVGDTVCLWADVSYDPDVSGGAFCGGMDFEFSWVSATADTNTVSIATAKVCYDRTSDKKISECLTFTQPGTYVRRLTVTDSDGLSDHVDVTITILAYKYGLRVNYEIGQETFTTISTVDVLLTLVSPNGFGCRVAGSGGQTTTPDGNCQLGVDGMIRLRDDTDSRIDILLSNLLSGQYQIKIKYLNDCSDYWYEVAPPYCARHLSPNRFKLELYKDYNGVIAEQIIFSTEAELAQVGDVKTYEMSFPSLEILGPN